MAEIIGSLTQAFTLAFVVTSMFGLGLALTMRQILDALKDVRLVLLALLANFVIMPAAAWLLSRLFSLAPELQIGVVLMALAAGAPLTIRASQAAKGDLAFAGSLVALQVLVTVVVLPLLLPLLIPGIEVDTVGLALPLVLQILLPLGLGLLMNVRYDEEAEMTRPIMGEISNISLALMFVLNLTNLPEVIGLLGTGAIITVLVIIGIGLASGYLLGGPAAPRRRTLAIATGQRNYAAALTIAAGSLGAEPTVILLLLTASLLSMIIIIPVAGEMGRRAKREQEAAQLGVAQPARGNPAG